MTSVAMPPSAGIIQQVMSSTLANQVVSLGRAKKRENANKNTNDCLLAQTNLQTKRRKQQPQLQQLQPHQHQTKKETKGETKAEECIKVDEKGKEEIVVDKPRRIVKKRFVQKISCVPSPAISLSFLKEIADPFLCPPTPSLKGEEGDENLVRVTPNTLPSSSSSSSPSPSAEIKFNSTLFGDSLLAQDIEGKDFTPISLSLLSN
jgi:hypothetical protein